MDKKSKSYLCKFHFFPGIRWLVSRKYVEWKKNPKFRLVTNQQLQRSEGNFPGTTIPGGGGGCGMIKETGWEIFTVKNIRSSNIKKPGYILSAQWFFFGGINWGDIQDVTWDHPQICKFRGVFELVTEYATNLFQKADVEQMPPSNTNPPHL